MPYFKNEFMGLSIKLDSSLTQIIYGNGLLISSKYITSVLRETGTSVVKYLFNLFCIFSILFL